MTLLQNRDHFEAAAVSMSVAAPRVAFARPAGLGDELRAAREALGWTVPEIAAGLRIREAYLDAIEEGRFADLPGQAYALGFVRSYAGVLGLDPDEAARRYRAESPVAEQATLDFPEPVARRGLPPAVLIVAGIVLAGAGWVWFQTGPNRSGTAQVVADVPARLQTMLPGGSTPSPQVASLLPPGATEQSMKAAEAALPKAAAEPAIVGPPSAAVPSQASPTVATDPVAEAQTSGGRVVLRATADSWMEVRDRRDSSVLLDRVMHGGESWPVPAGSSLVLTTGNAGGTELVVDGVATPVPGGTGAVRRDLSLDPDAVRSLLAATTPRAVTP